MDENIFDEADEILSDDSLNEEEKSFNDSELQDIMSEIEDLEKEFEDTTAVAEVVAPKAQVLAFEKVAPKAKTASAVESATAGSEVSFAAHGQMSLNLDFKVGTETATLTIDPVKGLIVTLSGVELCINEDSGCTVSMENGTKFTIPLSSQANSLKKKAV